MSYRIAGIDVNKKMVAVVVSDVEVDGEYRFERRMFGSSPEQLRSLAAWLIEQEAEEPVMESTAQYWKPVWAALERYWKPLREKPQWSDQKRPTVVRSKPANGCGPGLGSFTPSSLDPASLFSFSSSVGRISGCDRGVAAGRAWR